MVALNADPVAAAGGGCETGQHFAALLDGGGRRVAAALLDGGGGGLTLSTALASLDGGDAAACWRNPAVGGHATAADARAVSHLFQEPPRAGVQTAAKRGSSTSLSRFALLALAYLQYFLSIAMRVACSTAPASVKRSTSLQLLSTWDSPLFSWFTRFY